MRAAGFAAILFPAILSPAWAQVRDRAIPSLGNLSAPAGRITEYPLPAGVVAQTGGLPSGITVARDGSVWFVLSGGGIGSFSRGRFTGYPVTVPPPYAAASIFAPIAQGPDSALYAAVAYEQNGSFNTTQGVVRIAPSGHMTSSTFDNVPTSTIYDLAFGADNRVYVTTQVTPPASSQQSGGLAAMRNPGYANASSASIVFPDYTNNFAPQALTAGEDGSIWVAATNQASPSADLLYRISTGLRITARFGLPRNSAVTGLVWGADDALWFTESGRNKIGRLTGTGRVTEFNVPTPNSGLQRLALGCDGTMWFTENKANKIGRITLAGTITEYRIPTANSFVYGITAPPSNIAARTIWFTEPNVNKIGVLQY
ncbi:MAG: virginiamycin B lyase [Candidatus Velthaea sp.]